MTSPCTTRQSEIGGQFNIAKQVPGKEEFYETLRFYARQIDITGVKLKLNTRVSAQDLSAAGFDQVVLATGVTPRLPAIEGIDHPKVCGYLDVLRDKREVGKTVALIGAGGIGFDVAEYLLHGGTSPSQDPAKFFAEWGVDTTYAKRGGLMEAHIEKSPRKVFLLQRKASKVGDGLGKTTGWIHRTSLKNRHVEMIPGVTYRKVDDAGLHITVGDKEQIIPADTIVVCAGQDPQRELQAELAAAGVTVHLIGGADKAAELDAKRAIKQGFELAVALQTPPAPAEKATEISAPSAAAAPQGKNMSYKTLTVTLENHIVTVRLNRPEKANAMNVDMWQEIRQAFRWVDDTPDARVAILEGDGKLFTAGIDLEMMMGMGATIHNDCEARMRENLRRVILDMQDTLTSLERCRKPVLAAIHGGCVGGGIDLITCADMRYCSSDAYFTIKEIDIGMTADVGTLQRLPKLIGEGMARELAYTGRRFTAAEARDMRLVNQVFDSREALQAGVREMAATIAAKSPLAIRGTKEMITYARDHSVADSLNYIATWNAAMLLSDDLQEAMMANMGKRPAEFKN